MTPLHPIRILGREIGFQDFYNKSQLQKAVRRTGQLSGEGTGATCKGPSDLATGWPQVLATYAFVKVNNLGVALHPSIEPFLFQRRAGGKLLNARIDPETKSTYKKVGSVSRIACLIHMGWCSRTKVK